MYIYIYLCSRFRKNNLRKSKEKTNNFLPTVKPRTRYPGRLVVKRWENSIKGTPKNAYFYFSPLP